MPLNLISPNRTLLISIIVVVILGISSRLIYVGSPLFDKYLGDALYAILFYLLLCLVWRQVPPYHKVWLTTGAMLVIEAFQLTLIPRQLRLSGNEFLKILSIGLGIKFSWLDIAAYMVGIAAIWIIDVYALHFSRPQAEIK